MWKAGSPKRLGVSPQQPSQVHNKGEVGFSYNLIVFVDGDPCLDRWYKREEHSFCFFDILIILIFSYYYREIYRQGSFTLLLVFSKKKNGDPSLSIMLKSIIETNIQIPIGLSIKKKKNQLVYFVICVFTLWCHQIPQLSMAYPTPPKLLIFCFILIFINLGLYMQPHLQQKPLGLLLNLDDSTFFSPGFYL